jgi:hypothetical protein
MSLQTPPLGPQFSWEWPECHGIPLPTRGILPPVDPIVHACNGVRYCDNLQLFRGWIHIYGDTALLKTFKFFLAKWNDERGSVG